MKEWKRRIETAPKSLIVNRATSSEPAAITGHSCGRTTVRKTSSGPRPIARAASSSCGSIRRRLARSGISSSGKVKSVSTSQAPVKP